MLEFGGVELCWFVFQRSTVLNSDFEVLVAEGVQQTGLMLLVLGSAGLDRHEAVVVFKKVLREAFCRSRGRDSSGARGHRNSVWVHGLVTLFEVEFARSGNRGRAVRFDGFAPFGPFPLKDESGVTIAGDDDGYLVVH
jgi:hypothetical protein